jgi:CRP-like cAMP-binding protein
MTKLSLPDLLRTMRFLDELSDAERSQLARVARLEEFPANKVIFREAQRAGKIFLIVEGTVGLEICVPEHGARRVQTLVAGELLGWSPLLGPYAMTATARAITPTEVVAFDTTELLGLFHDNPGLGFNFMRRTATALAQRLSATRLRLLDAYRNELPVVAGVHEGAD